MASSYGTELEKIEFDMLVVDDKFSDGPYRETFGDGYGEPYCPHRRAYGTLKDGRAVWCWITNSPEAGRQ